jgi:hypothetical protein
MTISFEQAAAIVNKTVPEFIDWTQSMEGSDYIINFNDEDIKCVYTDGDQGVLCIIGNSEIFLEEGATIQMVDGSNFCDINFKDFTMMTNEIKELVAL